MLALLALLACQTPPPAEPAAPAPEAAPAGAAASATPPPQAPVGLPRTAPPSFADDAVYAVAGFPPSTPPLADGDGRDDVAGYCSVCHATTYITMQPPLPPEKWKAEVDKMVKTYGAGVPDDAQARIVAYLSAHYAPAP